MKYSVTQSLQEDDQWDIQKHAITPFFYLPSQQFLYYFKAPTGYVQFFKVRKNIIVIGIYAKDSYEAVIRDFYTYCKKKHFILFWMFADEQIKEIVEQYTFRSIRIGYDAFFDHTIPFYFDINNRNKRIDQPFSNEKIKKKYHVEALTEDIPSYIERCNGKRQKPLYFVLDEAITDDYEKVLYLARKEDTIVAYALFYFLPYVQTYYLRSMQKIKNTSSVAMDVCLIEAFADIYKKGYDVNLGIMPLAGIHEDEKKNIGKKILSVAYNRNLFSQYSFKGLVQFKEKYKPDRKNALFFLYKGAFPIHIFFLMLYLLLKKPKYI